MIYIYKRDLNISKIIFFWKYWFYKIIYLPFKSMVLVYLAYIG